MTNPFSHYHGQQPSDHQQRQVQAQPSYQYQMQQPQKIHEYQTFKQQQAFNQVSESSGSEIDDENNN